MHTYLFSTETLKVILFLSILTAIFSCSKDTDLLAEYVSKDGLEVAKFGSFVMDDQYMTSRDKSIVLNVLSNDVFANFDKVKIVETSTAKNGRIVINADNTLTYTPSGNTIPRGPKNQTETTDTPETTTSDTTDTSDTETPTTETPDTSSETPESTDTPETTTSDTTDTTETTDTPDTTETPTTETTDTSSETPDTQEPETPITVESSEETSTDEETSDTFTYTTEEENEDGTVTTDEGTVTITFTAENAYYVTVTGSTGNDGKSEDSAWPLAHAIKTAVSGDTVYVKSGSYNSSNLTFSRNGTSSNPIVFIGYTTNPGDLLNQSGSSYKRGDTPATSDMPIINVGNAQSGVGVLLDSDYVELHNMLVTNTNYAFRVRGDNNLINNCVATNLGRIGDVGYEGIGVYVTGNNNTVSSTFVSNACAEGMNDGGRGNNFLYNQVHYEQRYETDYNFVLKGDGSGGIFKGNESYKHYQGVHEGRAYVIKGGNNYVLEDNYAYKCKLQINHSSNNLVDGLVMEGFSSGQVEIQNGSNDNVIRNFYIEVGYGALIFNNNVEYSVGTGNNNFIYNGVFKGGKRTVLVRDDAGQGASLSNVVVSNVIFDGQSGVLDISSPVSDLNFINCVFINQTNSSRTGGRSPGSADISYSHCSFANNNWPTPSGTNLLEVDPLFTNSGSGMEKYRLQSGSKLIDAGMSVTNRTTDCIGTVISGNPDIGAYEN